jgi:endoglucanase
MIRRAPGVPAGSPRGTLAAVVGILVSLALLVGGAASSTTAPASSGGDGDAPSAGPTVPSVGNPLAGRPWGVYLGPSDQAWEPWTRSSGRQRRLLDRIVLQPKAQWYGHWVPDDEIDDRIRTYLANASGGDPEVLVQMAIFRMDPWEGDICRKLPTTKQVTSYKRWIRRAATAIGAAHVALILQPDGPFALCAPHGSKLPSLLIRYAARRFTAQPHTSVYIDAGADDWNRSDPATALKILRPAGIDLVRGFALNSTHYDSTAAEIEYGSAVVAALTEAGIPGRHFVINTAENGRPFKGYEYDGPDFDNARVCKTQKQHRCVTLGIPPTVDVADPKWGLTLEQRLLAAANVDAYLWFGRPWLYRQASPFLMRRALTIARTTPWQ